MKYNKRIKQPRCRICGRWIKMRKTRRPKKMLICVDCRIEHMDEIPSLKYNSNLISSILI